MLLKAGTPAGIPLYNPVNEEKMEIPGREKDK
jgi:hypothetical protein